MAVVKRLERAVAGFNHARTITKTFAKGLDTRQDDYNKGICSPGSLVNNPVRSDSLGASFPLKRQVVLDFQMSQIGKYYLILFNEHMNKIICIKLVQKISSNSRLNGSSSVIICLQPLLLCSNTNQNWWSMQFFCMILKQCLP